jgi:hypothetical protein
VGVLPMGSSYWNGCDAWWRDGHVLCDYWVMAIGMLPCSFSMCEQWTSLLSPPPMGHSYPLLLWDLRVLCCHNPVCVRVRVCFSFSYVFGLFCFHLMECSSPAPSPASSPPLCECMVTHVWVVACFYVREMMNG